MVAKIKSRYKVTNWREYNESLVSRGDITIWFSEDALDSWEHPNDTAKVGRLNLAFCLALRTSEGRSTSSSIVRA